MKRSQSIAYHQRAKAIMPGGVSSPVRSFDAVHADPVHIVAADGAYLTDADGNRLIDMIGGWGSALLGHAHREVVEAVQRQASLGSSFGVSSPLEAQLAERIIDRVPSIESIRFVNSGTEAVMSAIRLARAATGRELIVKFEGNYHGHADGLLGDAGSGPLTLGLSKVAGVPQGALISSVTTPYNAMSQLDELFQRFGDKIAAVIVEPIAGNMGLVKPVPGFLETITRLTRQHGALLIFDEVMTGLRVSSGGAQQRLGFSPDITTLGKVIGGGLPVGAYGGRRELMELVAPAGKVYQAGTASGNPLTMAAGIATIDQLSESTYTHLDAATTRLVDGLDTIFGGVASVTGIGSMAGIFFSTQPVTNMKEARAANHNAYAYFFREMLERGVLLPPSGYESWFLSTAHSNKIIDRVLESAHDSFKMIATMHGELRS